MLGKNWYLIIHRRTLVRSNCFPQFPDNIFNTCHDMGKLAHSDLSFKYQNLISWSDPKFLRRYLVKHLTIFWRGIPVEIQFSPLNSKSSREGCCARDRRTSGSADTILRRSVRHGTTTDSISYGNGEKD